ncbi:hypothetical protein QFC22_001643 [Naganishia vaughanmartiniae]|uniref:Uncharacterized protein n=1 Tax=Naganishia vaughanmartiniae TaxID=1424756 RepID=A0ACC2XIN4_9TREE|nr:hypothetical protein QFC22_001643 [Naganishia vaughanmartiniae]
MELNYLDEYVTDCYFYGRCHQPRADSQPPSSGARKTTAARKTTTVPISTPTPAASQSSSRLNNANTMLDQDDKAVEELKQDLQAIQQTLTRATEGLYEARQEIELLRQLVIANDERVVRLGDSVAEVERGSSGKEVDVDEDEDDFEEKVQGVLQRLGLVNLDGRLSAAFLEIAKKKANFPRNEKVLVRYPNSNLPKRDKRYSIFLC